MEDFSAINISLSVGIFLIQLRREDAIGIVADELLNGFGFSFWY